VTTTDNKSHISIKILRIKLESVQDENRVPIIEVRFQNIVTHFEESIYEEEFGKTVRFIESTVKIPIDQMDFSAQDLKLRIRVYHRNLLTEHDDILSRLTVPSDTMRKWIANGRFEGKLDFDTSTKPAGLGDHVQIVFKTIIQKPDNIESLFHIREKGFTCQASKIVKNKRSLSKAMKRATLGALGPSVRAKEASDKCVRNRQDNGISSHTELQTLFDVEAISVSHSVPYVKSNVCVYININVTTF
jgi:hypothetical protein